ncbi:MAG: hypothetical protein WC052_05970 [Patescibacteria group bacterium]
MSNFTLSKANLFIHRLVYARECAKADELRKEFPTATVNKPQPNFGVYFDSISDCASYLLLNFAAPTSGMVSDMQETHGYPDDDEGEGCAILMAYASIHGIPSPDTYDSNTYISHCRRVVASACKYGEFIAVGSRHFSPAMSVLNLIKEEVLINEDNNGRSAQGFIDQWDVFMTREEAYEVALAAGQLNTWRIQGHDVEKLHSEDIH